MLIDTHMHIGQLYVGEPPLTPDYLIAFMDRNGIERSILLPIESPEEAHFYVTTEEVLEACEQYPDRFVPACNVDPRIGSGDNTAIIEARLGEYRGRGCVAYGEAMTGFWIDDRRLQRVYAACGELGMPVIYHIDRARNRDEVGFPRLERMLKQFPHTVFVGHAQHFWAEISGDTKIDQFSGYPSGPVAPGGAIIRLFDTYPNLFADISAGSGYNALTRTPEFGYEFVERFRDRLFFGTDLCRYNQEVPNVGWLNDAHEAGHVSREAYDLIARGNAIRVFGL